MYFNFPEGLVRRFDVILYTCLFYYNSITSITFQFLFTFGKICSLAFKWSVQCSAVKMESYQLDNILIKCGLI